MVDTANVRDKLEQRASLPEVSSPQRTIYDLLEKHKGEIARALPTGQTAERFARIVFTEVRKNPALAECSPESLMAAVLLAAQLGLEPGPLGHAWLVPFRNRKTKTREVQFIPGYRGLILLAHRSGRIESLVAREACEHDVFNFEYGLNETLVHRPALTNRGRVIAYYGVAHFKGGGHAVLVMSPEDIEKRRQRSRAKDDGPWMTDYDAMARKTVIRAMASFLPMSPEDHFARALAVDEAVVPADVNLDDMIDLRVARPERDDAPDYTQEKGGAGSDAVPPPPDDEGSGASDAAPPAPTEQSVGARTEGDEGSASAAAAPTPAPETDIVEDTGPDPVQLAARARAAGIQTSERITIIRDAAAPGVDVPETWTAISARPELLRLLEQHLDKLERDA